MGLLSVTECTLLKGSGKNDQDSPTQQRQFYVRFDAKPLDFDAVTEAAGVPAIGAAFKTGDNRKLKSKSASSIGTVLDFIVTCDYSIPDLGTFEANPLSRKDILKGGGTSKDQPYFMDNSDDPQPVVTSAYEPFERLPENTIGQWSITITGNRASLDLPTWTTYLDPTKGCAVNSDAFTIRGVSIGAGQAKLVNIRFSPKTEGQYNFWEVEWELRLAPHWDQDIDDRGYYQLTDDTTGIVPIYSADGTTPVSKPFPLDGTGYAESDPSNGQAYMTFKPQPAKSFGVFNFSAGA